MRAPDSVKAPGAPVKSGHFIARGSVALLSGRQNFLNRSLFEVGSDSSFANILLTYNFVQHRFRMFADPWFKRI
jgi:hypothetical protein